MSDIKKIVVIGPESTGKSTLCSGLAKHFDALWVKEYAREYLLEHGMAYSYDDLLTIAKGQLKGEDDAIQALLEKKKPPLLFIDTDMYVMKVWCEHVFNQCHPFILEQIATRRYDLYLLCATDLPWVKDELREYPDLATRDHLYHRYETLLANQQTPWTVIRGSEHDRLEAAIAAVNRQFSV
jgi:NadR type nicotinamide-nucleotide adenylyltransferase